MTKKEEAIKMLKSKMDGHTDTSYEWAETVRMAIKALEQTMWIPVSERLPKTNDDMLVYDGVDMFVAWYSWKGEWQGWDSCDDNFEKDTPIISWMPLPHPYKAEMED